MMNRDRWEIRIAGQNSREAVHIRVGSILARVDGVVELRRLRLYIIWLCWPLSKGPCTPHRLIRIRVGVGFGDIILVEIKKHHHRAM